MTKKLKNNPSERCSPKVVGWDSEINNKKVSKDLKKCRKKVHGLLKTISESTNLDTLRIIDNALYRYRKLKYQNKNFYPFMMEYNNIARSYYTNDIVLYKALKKYKRYLESTKKPR